MGRGRGGNRGGRPIYGAKALGGGVALKDGSFNYVEASRKEYDKAIASGKYSEKDSIFYENGGYVLSENGRVKKPVSSWTWNKKTGKKELSLNYEEKAARFLAHMGYKIRLDKDSSTIDGKGISDGRVSGVKMDIKTITNVGKYTLEKRLQKTGYQNGRMAVVVNNSPNLSDKYIKQQIEYYKDHLNKIGQKVKFLMVVKVSNRRPKKNPIRVYDIWEK